MWEWNALPIIISRLAVRKKTCTLLIHSFCLYVGHRELLLIFGWLHTVVGNSHLCECLRMLLLLDMFLFMHKLIACRTIVKLQLF